MRLACVSTGAAKVDAAFHLKFNWSADCGRLDAQNNPMTTKYLGRVFEDVM